MASPTPEIIIFYIDMATKILKRKHIMKALDNFMEEKLEKIPNSTFCAFYYKEGDQPFLTEETQDIKHLINQLEDDWKQRDTSKSYFENGLFYCLSFLAEKAVQKAGNYRVIVLSDTPSRKRSEYAEALMELVETVRNFPTFIDIIRIGESEMYPDDVKLRIISTITSGGLFYVEDRKDFASTLIGLAKNKTLPDLRQEGGQAIDQDKKAYYEKMAKTLQPTPLTKDTKCSICSEKICKYCEDPKDILECPSCGVKYHGCCAGLYTWKYNIGLKHIFRCVNCQSLLKMDERLVYELNGETPPGIEEIETKEDLEEATKEEETWEPEKPEEEVGLEEQKTKEKHVIKESKKMESKQKELSKTQTKKPTQVKMGLFGPTVVKKSSAKKVDGQKIEKKTKNEPKTEATAHSASSKKSTLADRRKRSRSRRSNVHICKVCSTRLKPGQTVCPNCGSPYHD